MLRREFARQLERWQTELPRPRTCFSNWNLLLDARLVLHHLDEICEDRWLAPLPSLRLYNHAEHL